MLYITGDTHGCIRKWKEQIHPVLKAEDTIIVAGDFGVGGWKDEEDASVTEEQFYDWISKQPYSVLFVDGNHENFDKLYAYPVEMWMGGNVHKLRPNLIHLMRGEVYEIDGKKIFTFGGGYSIDKAWRVEGRSWWPQEMPSEKEYENARRNLEKNNDSVDYIITHTTCAQTVHYMAARTYMRIKTNITEEMPLTAFLETTRINTRYRGWYFGHFHMDMTLWKNQFVVFNSMRELESGKIVREWCTYEGY